jgi:hypothetical protein
MNDHEAAPADVARGGIRHGHGERRGDGGIHGIATTQQHIASDIRAGWGDGDDHTVFVGGNECSGKECNEQ